MTNTQPPRQSVLDLEEVARRVEADESNSSGAWSGMIGDRQILWRKLDDGSYVYQAGGWEIKVARYASVVRRLETLQVPSGGQLDEVVGAKAIFWADVSNCDEAMWVQYLERDFSFDGAALGSQHRKLEPQIDEAAPYGIQLQERAGSSIMADYAGIVSPEIPPNWEKIATQGIALYAGEVGLSGTGIRQCVAKHKFWTYLVCQKPAYVLLGHFEWGYTNELNPSSAPFTRTTRDEFRWISNR